MLILYTKNNCHYCEKVKEAFLASSVSYEERNIENEEYLEEAKARGAKTMPFLVDTFANLAMGESDEIINYGCECAF
jgi:glutaredoxin